MPFLNMRANLIQQNVSTELNLTKHSAEIVHLRFSLNYKTLKSKHNPKLLRIVSFFVINY